ncbi:MAG: hypothetical protein PXZ07_09220, partial [Candidatus Eremiobacteraeota bacterium]|nr:hypothetical protein [Candidatus Eremiobacteraeota bacterium]
SIIENGTPLPTPTPSASPTPTATPTATPTPTIVFDLDPLYIGALTSCPVASTPYWCFSPLDGDSPSSDGIVQEHFTEVGGYSSPYAYGTTNSLIAWASQNTNPSGYFDVVAGEVGKATLKVTAANGDVGNLPITVTTLQVPINFVNLTTAYSITVTGLYTGGCTSGITDTTSITLPTPVPANYTFTLVNYPTSQSQNCSPWEPVFLTDIGVTVSNGAYNIASDSQPVNVVPGTAMMVALNPH